jgi:hypothetical protein
MTDVSILGANAVEGDPAVVDSLASTVGSLASRASDISQRLRSETIDGAWKGEAADAFRNLLTDTPDLLQQAVGSFDAAKGTLLTYGSELQGASYVAQRLAQELEQVQAGHADAQRTLVGAQKQLHSATHAMQTAGSDPIARAQAQQTLDQATNAVGRAQAQVSAANSQEQSILRQAASNREQFNVAVARCCAGLDHALDMGFKNSPWSFAGRAWHDMSGVLSALGGIVVQAIHLAPDLIAFIQHPSLAGLKKVLDDVTAVLTIVAFVALIVLAVVQPETAPLLWAAAEGAMTFSVVGSRVTAAAEIGADSLRAAKGEASLWDIGLDAVGFAASGTALRQWRTAQELSEGARSASWATRYIRYEGTAGYRGALTTGRPQAILDRIVPFASRGKGGLIVKRSYDLATRGATTFTPPSQTKSPSPILRSTMKGNATHRQLNVLSLTPAPTY